MPAAPARAPRASGGAPPSPRSSRHRRCCRRRREVPDPGEVAVAELAAVAVERCRGPQDDRGVDRGQRDAVPVDADRRIDAVDAEGQSAHLTPPVAVARVAWQLAGGDGRDGRPCRAAAEAGVGLDVATDRQRRVVGQVLDRERDPEVVRHRVEPAAGHEPDARLARLRVEAAPTSATNAGSPVMSAYSVPAVTQAWTTGMPCSAKGPTVVARAAVRRARAVSPSRSETSTTSMSGPSPGSSSARAVSLSRFRPAMAHRVVVPTAGARGAPR
jgi:hypothetical protein